MEREIIKIDEDKCNGCGQCVPNCHEGALQIIDGKVRLISDLMCDGLGACIGHCPEDAITIEHREAEPYDEVKVMEIMVSKGFNTVVAHLRHLKEHHEIVFLKQGMSYLSANESKLNFMVNDVKNAVHQLDSSNGDAGCAGGCPGSKTIIFDPAEIKMANIQNQGSLQSQLRQWPVQLHLINPGASHFVSSDLLVAADCSSFALGDFHQNWLKNKTLVIACPKLDQGKEIYLQKFITLIDNARVNTITVMIMEVPCCGGLLQLVEMAISRASRKVPVKAITVSIKGEILSEEWV
jgi:NAD-dependent dihydropyrimidine dehydrogenase PreA subunit